VLREENFLWSIIEAYKLDNFEGAFKVDTFDEMVDFFITFLSPKSVQAPCKYHQVIEQSLLEKLPLHPNQLP